MSNCLKILLLFIVGNNPPEKKNDYSERMIHIIIIEKFNSHLDI